MLVVNTDSVFGGAADSYGEEGKDLHFFSVEHGLVGVVEGPDAAATVIFIGERLLLYDLWKHTRERFHDTWV